MKKTCLVLIVLAAAMSALCSPGAAAIEVAGDAYVGVFDKYLWRGFDLSAGEPVAQGGINLTAGGFTLSYWTSVQLSSNDD
jgi:hypothetical protein